MQCEPKWFSYPIKIVCNYRHSASRIPFWKSEDGKKNKFCFENVSNEKRIEMSRNFFLKMNFFRFYSKKKS